eukprot:COSAG03_NODE_272_length_9583_cov_5.194538_6_plen_184_part_00
MYWLSATCRYTIPFFKTVSCSDWTGQFKDDALAMQGYTRGNRIRGGTVRLGKVQSTGGAACIKLSGTSDVIVSDVFCEGHMNSLTIDYSQYTDHPHSEIIVSNLIGVDPVANGINLWGSGFPAAGVCSAERNCFHVLHSATGVRRLNSVNRCSDIFVVTGERELIVVNPEHQLLGTQAAGRSP